MSAKLPALSGKQVIAALEKDGWYVKRVRGSHHVLRHKSIPDAIPVPVQAIDRSREERLRASSELLASIEMSSRRS